MTLRRPHSWMFWISACCFSACFTSSAVPAESTAQAQPVSLLIEQSVERSPEVQKVRAELRAAQADIDIVQSRWLPQVDARIYQGIANTEQSNPFFKDRSERDNVKNNSISIQQAVYNQPLRIQLHQAQMGQQAATLRFIQAQQNALQQWLQSLLGCKQAQANLQLLHTQLGTLTLAEAQTRQALSKGESSPLELGQVQADLDLKKAEMEEATEVLQHRLAELGALTGQPLGAEWLAGLQLITPTTPKTVIANNDREQRPFLPVAIQALEVDLARMDAAKATAGHQPTLKLLAQNSRSQSDTVSTLGTQTNQHVVALQLDIPLYAGGGVEAQREKADANLALQQAVMERVLMQSALDAQAAERQLRISQQWASALRTAAEAAKQQGMAIEAAIQHQLNTPLDLAKQREKEMDLKIKAQDRVASAIKAWLTLLALDGELTAQKSTVWIEEARVEP